MEGWIEGSIQNSGGVRGPPGHAIKFSNASMQSIRPALVGERRNNYSHASLQSWVVVQAFPFIFSLITLFLHFSLTHKIFTLFLVSLPSSPLTFVPRAVFCHRLLLLARFQVNQKQIQGRAQPNFGPPWKPWPGPHFYLFPEWQTPDDRACLPVTARVETSDLRPAAAFREFKLAAEISTDTADADSHDCLLV